MQSGNDTLLAVGFSDANGNLTVPVTSGQWGVASDSSGLTIHGYVGYNNGTNINSGSPTVVIPFSKATALFYGTVSNNLGNPIVNVGVNAQENNNIFNPEGYTDPNGNYFVAALGLSNDPWQLNLSGDNSSFSCELYRLATVLRPEQRHQPDGRDRRARKFHHYPRHQHH